MTSTPSLLRITPQIVIGAIVIAFGLTLTADNLGWVEADQVFRFWPFVLMAVGVAKLLQTHNRSGRVFGLLLVLVGGSIAADEFLSVRINLFTFWPLLLVAVGAVVVFRALSGPAQQSGSTDGIVRPFGARETSDQTLSDFAFWSGVKRRVSSPAFRGGDLTAIMGGIELDLRSAATGGGEAVIDVFVLWGGIEITVPPDWTVSNRITPILGGADDSSTGSREGTNRLVLRGFVVMGGVEIKT